mmetsp:Transcript_6352/g.13766  ORF Transcript_6352/g.13766 Transcript_6352/m.13766 type:complete len:1072 (+) Transcript_6352:154-3369(+)
MCAMPFFELDFSRSGSAAAAGSWRQRQPPLLGPSPALLLMLPLLATLFFVTAAAEEGANPFTTPAPYHFVPPAPTQGQMHCLKEAKEGCRKIRDEATCLNSRDGDDSVTEDEFGLKHFGEPCVWCGGSHCRRDGNALCEPYDFLVHGEAKGAFGKISDDIELHVAQCEGGVSEAAVVGFDCLTPNPLGCFRLEDESTCLSSLDGSQTQTLDGFLVAGQPCVWCGGACTSKDTASCAPQDWVQGGEGKAFDTFLAKSHFRAASCSGGKPIVSRPYYAPEPTKNMAAKTEFDIAVDELGKIHRAWYRPPHPTDEDSSCLRILTSGCSLIRDEATCLSSRDGRNEVTPYSKKSIYGEPCVWCGGGKCESSTNSLCAPFNYLMYGESQDGSVGTSEFLTFHAKSVFKVATCEAGKPLTPAATPWGGTKAFWSPPEAPGQDTMTCLEPLKGGCEAAEDIGTCMNSMDGSSTDVDELGLRHKNQACVWCGGIACDGQNKSKCLPFDYVMRGEGKAFQTFMAKASYSVATCKRPASSRPQVQQAEELTCLTPSEDRCFDLSDEASCVAHRAAGEADKIGRYYAGLRVEGQACVWCGGLACTSANSSVCAPFDYAVNGAGRAYDYSFASAAWKVGYCEVGAAKVASALLPVPQVKAKVNSEWDKLTLSLSAPAFGQCGGIEWTGPTQCPAGYVCEKKSEKFSQCVGKTVYEAELRGSYITDGSAIYWKDPEENQKHLVSDPSMCAACHCAEQVVQVTTSTLAETPSGGFFNCDLLKAHPEGGLGPPVSGGRFVESGGKVYWQSPQDGRKHFVPDDLGCDICGCRNKTVQVDDDLLGAMEEGRPFSCSMLKPDLTFKQIGVALDEEGYLDRSSMFTCLLVSAAICIGLLLAGFWYFGLLDAFQEERGTRWKRTRGVDLERDESSDELLEGSIELGSGSPNTSAASPQASPGLTQRIVTFSGHQAQAKASLFMGVPIASPSNQYRQTGVAPIPREPLGTPPMPQEPVRGLQPTPPMPPREPLRQNPTRVEPVVGGPRRASRDFFDAIDLDHDGRITRDEWRTFARNSVLQASGSASMQAPP